MHTPGQTTMSLGRFLTLWASLTLLLAVVGASWSKVWVALTEGECQERSSSEPWASGFLMPKGLKRVFHGTLFQLELPIFWTKMLLPQSRVRLAPKVRNLQNIVVCPRVCIAIVCDY